MRISLSLQPVSKPIAQWLETQICFPVTTEGNRPATAEEIREIVEITAFNGATALAIGSLALTVLGIMSIAKTAFACLAAYLIREAFANDQIERPVRFLQSAAAAVITRFTKQEMPGDPVALQIGGYNIFMSYPHGISPLDATRWQ